MPEAERLARESARDAAVDIDEGHHSFSLSGVLLWLLLPRSRWTRWRAHSRALSTDRPRRWVRLPRGGPMTSVPMARRSGHRRSIIGWSAEARESIRAMRGAEKILGGASSISWAPGEKRA